MLSQVENAVEGMQYCEYKCIVLPIFIILIKNNVNFYYIYRFYENFNSKNILYWHVDKRYDLQNIHYYLLFEQENVHGSYELHIEEFYFTEFYIKHDKMFWKQFR